VIRFCVHASLLLAGGTAGDKWGHKRVVISRLAIFGAASLLCGVSPGVGTFPDVRRRRLRDRRLRHPGDVTRQVAHAGAGEGPHDLVVLIDPDDLGAGVEGAVDRCVAMTRATRQLVILTGHSSMAAPEGSSCERQ
jgi:hypothetical protein